MREKGMWATIGAVATAVVGSSCCWLPLILLALGAAAAATVLVGVVESFRIPILIVALVFLGLSAYFTYIRGGDSRIARLNRWLLPIVATVVVLFILIPDRIIALFSADRREPEIRAQENEMVIVLSVPGMT